MIELHAMNDISKLWSATVFLISVGLHFLFVFACFCILSFFNDHLWLVWAEQKPDGDTPSWAGIEALLGVFTIVVGCYCLVVGICVA